MVSLSTLLRLFLVVCNNRSYCSERRLTLRWANCWFVLDVLLGSKFFRRLFEIWLKTKFNYSNEIEIKIQIEPNYIANKKTQSHYSARPRIMFGIELGSGSIACSSALAWVRVCTIFDQFSIIKNSKCNENLKNILEK